MKSHRLVFSDIINTTVATPAAVAPMANSNIFFYIYIYIYTDGGRSGVAVIIIAAWYYLHTPTCTSTCVYPQPCNIFFVGFLPQVDTTMGGSTLPYAIIVVAIIVLYYYHTPAALTPAAPMPAAPTPAAPTPAAATCSLPCTPPSKCIVMAGVPTCTSPSYTFNDTSPSWIAYCNGEYTLSMQSPMVAPPGSSVPTDYVYTSITGETETAIDTVIVGVDMNGHVVPKYADMVEAHAYACNLNDNYNRGYWFGNSDSWNIFTPNYPAPTAAPCSPTNCASATNTCINNVCTPNCSSANCASATNTCINNVCTPNCSPTNCASATNTCINNVCTPNCSSANCAMATNTCINNVCTQTCSPSNCAPTTSYCNNNVCTKLPTCLSACTQLQTCVVAADKATANCTSPASSYTFNSPNTVWATNGCNGTYTLTTTPAPVQEYTTSPSTTDYSYTNTNSNGAIIVGVDSTGTIIPVAADLLAGNVAGYACIAPPGPPGGGYVTTWLKRPLTITENTSGTNKGTYNFATSDISWGYPSNGQYCSDSPDGGYTLTRSPTANLTPAGSDTLTDYVYTNASNRTQASIVGVDATGAVIPLYANLGSAAGYACNEAGGGWLGNEWLTPLTVTPNN